MTSAYPSPVIRQRFFDANGLPLAGGKLYSYTAGSSSLKNTYAGPSLSSVNDNPLILDDEGYGDVWLSGSYKFTLTDANDVELWTEDNITDVGTLIAAVYTDLANTSSTSKGDALVGTKRTVSSFATTVHAWIEGQALNVVSDFGATGDGSTDDTAAIQAALAAAVAGQSVVFPTGTYLISSTLTIGASNVSLVGLGNPIIKAKNAASFDTMIYAASKSDLTIANLVLDINKANRSTVINFPLNGLTLEGCTDSTVTNVKVKNSRGYNTAYGTGICLGTTGGTQCQRVRVVNCLVIDSGAASTTQTHAFADLGGTSNSFQGCTAYNMVGHGFYLENTTNCTVDNGLVDTCFSGAVVTNTGSNVCYNNAINGLTVRAWTNASAGAVQFTCSGSGTLVACSLTGANIFADTGAGKGAGAGAVYVTTSAAGEVQDIRITGVNIYGVNGSGMYIKARRALVSGCSIYGVTIGSTHYGIEFEGTTHALVAGCFIADGHSSVFAGSTSSVIQVSGCFLLTPSAYGVEAGTSSSLYSVMNNVISYGTAASGQSGSPAGSVIELTQLAAAIRASSYVGSAPAGAASGYIPAVDAAGSVLGNIPVYS